MIILAALSSRKLESYIVITSKLSKKINNNISSSIRKRDLSRHLLHSGLKCCLLRFLTLLETFPNENLCT